MEVISLPAILLAAVINAILGGVVLVNSNRTAENRLFILIIIGTILWPLTLFFYIQSPPHFIKLATQLAYLSGAYIPFIFAIFCIQFIRPISIFRHLLAKALLGLPFIALITTIFLDPGFILSTYFDFKRNVNAATFGPSYIFYAIYIILYFSLAFSILAYKFVSATEKAKKLQLAYVFAGTVLATLPAVFADLILPWLDSNFLYNWVGPAATIIMVGFISYAIFKHHLFEAKIVTTEIFTAFVLILLFLNIFTAISDVQRIFNIAIFIAAAGFGYLLIRSVLFEVSSREKIAKLAKQLQAVNEKLQQVDKVKTEFISIASHQLRTPLTIIKGYTSMALEGTFGRYTKQQHDVMDKLFQSANRLINLVEDLLNISRLEQGRIEYEYKVLDPVALVRGVVEELEQKAKKKSLRLVFIKPKKSVPHIRADEQKIRQVFINIIDNAIKYTEKGVVTVTIRRDEDKVRFESVDTGIGISKEDLSTLFKKFVRGAHVSQMYTEGVGLGLYFARKVAENHGGKLWAESAGEGKGSTFIVELPMAS